MATAQYPSFDEDQLQQSLDAAKQHSDRLLSATRGQEAVLADGALKIAGGACISVTVQNGQVCINLPLGIGSKCFNVPSWVPNGTACQACIDICTKWGIPCGVEVSISVAGRKIISQGFGCSC